MSMLTKNTYTTLDSLFIGSGDSPTDKHLSDFSLTLQFVNTIVSTKKNVNLLQFTQNKPLCSVIFILRQIALI